MEKKVQVRMNAEVDPGEMAKIVQLANQYKSVIYIEMDDNRRVNAKSIMGMMNFLAENGQEINLKVDGEDEAEAIEAIAGYLSKEK